VWGHVEKVHAYTRAYGQGHKSSRAKDLVDLVLVRISTDTGFLVGSHKWHSGDRAFDPRQLHQ
jgi:hypothetical protein